MRRESGFNSGELLQTIRLEFHYIRNRSITGTAVAEFGKFPEETRNK